MLRDQGYATACVGKWHLGWSWPKPGDNGKRDFTKPVPDGPTARGFDSYFGTDVPNYPPYCFIENDRTVGIPSEAAPVGRDAFNIAGPMVPGWKLVDVLPGLEKRAVEYIGKAAKGNKPFFLYLPLTSPHYPVVPLPAFKGKGKVGDYGDFVMQTDVVVGQVLDALKNGGALEDTLVIFTSDNGPEITGEVNPGAYDRLKEFGHASMGPLRGTKRDAWEGGHRVPFIARWPGTIKPGTACAETVCHVDLMATLTALLGVKLPADAGVDSVNILPPGSIGSMASANTGSVMIPATMNRRRMSRSSESSSLPACGVIGSRAIPHFGQVPGPSCTTSGCIGQVHFDPAAAGDFGASCFAPQHDPSRAGLFEPAYFAGSELNFARQWRLQKW